MPDTAEIAESAALEPAQEREAAAALDDRHSSPPSDRQSSPFAPHQAEQPVIEEEV